MGTRVGDTWGKGLEWQVLVIDDDQDVAGVLCRLVHRLPSFRVVGAATSAGQARRMIGDMKPDVLLLDIGLPDDCGIELLRSVRASAAEVDVIGVTADSSRDSVRSFMRLGAIDYLVKPFSPERLTRALARFDHQARVLRSQRLSQIEVDSIRSATRRMLPNDISEERLGDIRSVLLEAEGPLTAQEVADRTFVARVTARRYLELLVTFGEATASSLVTGPGRPIKTYEKLEVTIY